jgi:hypothetical protein
MNIKIIAISLVAASTLSGCFTTHVSMGKEPSGVTESARWPKGFFDNSPVDMAKHCNGGNIATVTLARSFIGDSITFDCAKGVGRAANSPLAPASIAAE